MAFASSDLANRPTFLLDGPECPDLWSEMNGKRGFGGRASMLNLPLYEAPACGRGGLLGEGFNAD